MIGAASAFTEKTLLDPPLRLSSVPGTLSQIYDASGYAFLLARLRNFGSEAGAVVLHPAASHATDAFNEIAKVRIIMRRVDLVRVDDKQRGLVEAEKEVIMSLDNLLEVGLGDPALDLPTSALDTLDQRADFRLKIDDKLRLGNVCGEKLKELFVGRKFRIVQVEVGEDPILLEEIIRDEGAVEELALGQVTQLLMA